MVTSNRVVGASLSMCAFVFAFCFPTLSLHQVFSITSWNGAFSLRSGWRIVNRGLTHLLQGDDDILCWIACPFGALISRCWICNVLSTCISFDTKRCPNLSFKSGCNRVHLCTRKHCCHNLASCCEFLQDVFLISTWCISFVIPSELVVNKMLRCPFVCDVDEALVHFLNIKCFFGLLIQSFVFCLVMFSVRTGKGALRIYYARATTE